MSPAHATSDASAPGPAPTPTGEWGAWLALTWFALVALAAFAELTGWEDLRLALTF